MRKITAAARIVLGRQDCLERGNLDAKQGWGHSRDMVRAHALLAQRGTAGEIYNVGSGREPAVSELLEGIVRLAKVNITIEKDPEWFRPPDASLNVADVSKLRAATGWTPEIPLERTLVDTLECWRRAV